MFLFGSFDIFMLRHIYFEFTLKITLIWLSEVGIIRIERVSNIFIQKKWMFIFIIFITLLSGCERSNPDPLNDYNLTITNNSPLDLKSIVVTVEGNNDSKINSLIDNNIGYKDIAKFHMKNGKQSFKITINPKGNYSVSKEFSEKFNTEEIVEYQIIIESNEITIQKINNAQ
ncbi:hypothetical protein [Paenibacillus azoreducens]|uniref:Uncharacterized protein n=1 Tax=Paenibacillus azoreducens TaxID=116718 RepID=A0A919YF63_9BACL|nr:hypothetical protein [Paenibacillus azoreducens]GIO50072.1 hypothetical protein J34TS1_48370 [Paenibacillus azoreducens]